MKILNQTIYDRRGQIGIVTLAIGMAPMVLMMIFAGYQLSDSGLQSSLTANLNSNQEGFQAQLMLGHILDSRTNGISIREYVQRVPYSDNPDSDIDKINSALRNHLDGKAEEYDLDVFYPNRSSLSLGTRGLAMNDYALANIPSTTGSNIRVLLHIEGWVAQAHNGEPTDSSEDQCQTNRCQAYR